MPYSTPKVTIDLDEYNDLKEKVGRNDKISNLKLLQTLGFIVLSMKQSGRQELAGRINEILNEHRITITHHAANSYEIEPEDVEVCFMKQPVRR